MESYFIDFTAYVDERKRPENFPKDIHVQHTVEVENDNQLKGIVNEHFMNLVLSQGWVVLKDPSEVLDVKLLTFDKRVYVPWHMLTHMDVKVTHLPKQRPPQDSIIPPSTLPPAETSKEGLSIN